MQTGRTDRAAWGESHPPAVEFEALQLAIAAARQTGGDLHIVHTTIPQGFATIHAARSEGVKVTGETCPHYLYFNDSDLERIGPEAKCGPPLRPAEIVEQLWQEVMAGRVDTIGSDHCPCPPEMKNAGQENIWKAWGGITGIQAMLPVLLTEGYHRRGLSLSEVVKMTSWNPARRFGLYPKKGNLNPGADADFTVVDLDREWTFSDQDMLSRYPLSPYRGAHFKGAVLSTYVRGQKVFENGKITVEPGYGEVLRRCSADSFFEQA
jgi:allantoinase